MTTALPRVAVIGLGAMGARLARNLRAGGYPVVVANRSPEPVRRLAAAGATAAASPADAAARADVVLVTVTDDDASETVWLDPRTGVLAGAPRGVLAIDAGTLSPGWVRKLAATATGAGLRFLEAPMIGSRPQVEARALVHLAGGPPEVLVDARGVLEESAARIQHVGDYGAAATLKLIVNAALATQVAVMAELLGVASRAGLDPAEAVRVLTDLPVTSPAAARAIGVMTAGDFTPNFPVRLAAKDLRYLTALADELADRTPMTRTALACYERADATGHADDDLTAVAATYR
ncbi:NAD(P)-dependent oxidoreductase [Streptomyces sp. HNM0663]|uniref:NAD(P)-dependent oxidoreductase n=1 Tax=Streptomyces chengmaiensis TaxID=3040919 RepID=A0ABT6HWD4_9ACTN|nr:NAD(P)-dependent oxidoreductase [Streptomyces chengmaiensis]MDH2393021.1 NAD(P)-dependent oxidoreductase [Streptomyces chengmaiensis]